MKRPPKLAHKTSVGADRRVRVVKLDSRSLLVLNIETVVEFSAGTALAVPGAVVWLKPMKGTTAEQMVAASELLKRQGAARVVQLPLEAEDVVVAKALVVDGGFATARQVVESLLAEVKEQSDEVAVIVRRAMDEAGL